MEVEKEVEGEQGLGSINIFLFSNGQQYSPPRKYYLKAEEVSWWDSTLGFLARSQYGPTHSKIDLHTIDGCKLDSPAELRNYAAYVAVIPPDPFIQAGYDKYLLKASRSWEKRQSKRNSGSELINSDDVAKQVQPTSDPKKDRSSDSKKDNRNIQTADKNIPLEVVYAKVVDDISQNKPLPRLSAEKPIDIIIPIVNQEIQRPPERIVTSPSLEPETNKVPLSKRETPKNFARFRRQTIPSRIATPEKSATRTRTLNKPAFAGVTHKVMDRNPLYGLKSPVRNRISKIEDAIKEMGSTSPKRTYKLVPFKQKETDINKMSVNATTLLNNTASTVKTQGDKVYKNTRKLDNDISVIKMLEDISEKVSRTNGSLIDNYDDMPTKIEKASTDLIKNCTELKNDDMADRNQNDPPQKIKEKNAFSEYSTKNIVKSAPKYTTINKINENEDLITVSSTKNTLPDTHYFKIKSDRTEYSTQTLEPKTVTSLVELNDIIKLSDYFAFDLNEIKSSTPNTELKRNNVYPIFSQTEPLERVRNENLQKTFMVENMFLYENKEKDLESSQTDAESVVTRTANAIEKKENNTEDMLTIPLVVFKSAQQPSDNLKNTIPPQLDSTPLVIMVDKGDIVDLKLNIEISTAAGILKTSKNIDTRKSRSFRNISTDATNNGNNDAMLTHSKSLQSVENENASQSESRKEKNMVVVQCACCERCKRPETNTLELKPCTDEQPYFVLMPLMTQLNRECSVRCPNITRTNEKQVQNSASLTVNSTTISAEIEKRVTETNVRSEMVVVRTEPSQTSTASCTCKASVQASSVCKDSQTQTDWCDVVLEARLQADGHYTFYLPALPVLKEYYRQFGK